MTASFSQSNKTILNCAATIQLDKYEKIRLGIPTEEKMNYNSCKKQFSLASNYWLRDREFNRSIYIYTFREKTSKETSIKVFEEYYFNPFLFL